VALSNLELADRQLRLFDDDSPLRDAVDVVREKYGFESLRLALAARRGFKRNDGLSSPSKVSPRTASTATTPRPKPG